MNLPKMNLHCHTTYSDGKHTIQQMVIKAIKLDLEFLAITDHFTDSWKSGIIPTLNSSEKIERYLKEIVDCRTYIKKSDNKLRLYKGIEIDIGSSEKYIKTLIDPNKFDIILFEYLETLDGLAFLNNLLIDWKRKESKKRFPIIGIAHLDPSFFILHGLDRLIQLLRQYNIYIEFNTRYSHYYSRQNEIFFQNLKKYGIPVAIGSDAHYTRYLGLIEDPLEAIIDYNLQNNLVLLIDMLNKV